MTNLNLIATGEEQQLILAYLQQNASEVLADKINNGAVIEKNGKRLVNKKTLDGFMQFASDEARKLVAKGAKSACVKSDTVFGWAIHYFEEDSIEGTLYNEDGSEFKAPAPVKTATTTPAVTYTPPKPQPKPQISMFDLLNNNSDDSEPDDTTIETDELTENETEEQSEPVKVKPEPPKPKGSAMWQHYLSVKEKYKDCIVFYRLGDFYEMFGEDAKVASDVLNLTLTGRDCGLKERVPMAGVPFHAVDNYIQKLVSKNYKVAVCELLEGEMNVDRVITKHPEYDNPVDLKTGELLHTQEQSANTADEVTDNEFAAFDSTAVAVLLELLDGKIDLQ